MAPYLAKVNTLGRRIVLIDAFAGPGKYQDGRAGSPLILVQAAEARAPNNYLAVFVNAERSQHEALSDLMRSRIDAGKVMCVHAHANTVLRRVAGNLGSATLLVYLDPFGIKDFDLATLLPFLQRPRSTELLITVQAPILHRLAARHMTGSTNISQPVRAFHDRLTATFGGPYWKSILLSDRPAREREEALMVAFTDHLLAIGNMKFGGWCPVKEWSGGRVKYYFVFCSSHEDAMALMNDIMLNAYEDYMHEESMAGTLFEGLDRPRASGVPGTLKEIVLEQVRSTPNLSRLQTWMLILRHHFREYSHGEYGRAVRQLVQDGDLVFRDVRGTGRINDTSVLDLSDSRRGRPV